MMENSSKQTQESYRFSVAPMMDYTDRHFRVLMRQITRKALLYTEMVVAQALYHTKKPNHLLDFDTEEHPIALQIGGDDPIHLANAARLAENWGYDEINFNVGCPSPRVQSGNFGACLMANPDLVARCVESMKKASSLTVTVKHRIGIDNLDNDILLQEFVDRVAAAGAQRFAIHARKAWLKGLNPKENRTIPPLQYERVENLKRNRPYLTIELNGGLTTPAECLQALKIFDGVMVGRAAYKHPLRWQQIDELIYKDNPQSITASKIIKNMLPYTQQHLMKNGQLWEIAKHFLNIVQEVPGARSWRKSLSFKAQKRNADLNVLLEAATQLEDVGL